jgi:formate hydrogenlyase subunit 6/NADH:ubiquinone oxidoreductase subunit I
MNQFIQSLKNIFSQPQTVNYPSVKLPKNHNYRGLIEYAEENCIYCIKCEKICPTGAIVFNPTKTPSNNPKNKKRLQYEYDSLLCIYCSLCTQACPKVGEALWQSNEKPEVKIKR